MKDCLVCVISFCLNLFALFIKSTLEIKMLQVVLPTFYWEFIVACSIQVLYFNRWTTKTAHQH